MFTIMVDIKFQQSVVLLAEPLDLEVLLLHFLLVLMLLMVVYILLHGLLV